MLRRIGAIMCTIEPRVLQCGRLSDGYPGNYEPRGERKKRLKREKRERENAAGIPLKVRVLIYTTPDLGDMVILHDDIPDYLRYCKNHGYPYRFAYITREEAFRIYKKRAEVFAATQLRFASPGDASAEISISPCEPKG
jgi:hypothetical protein